MKKQKFLKVILACLLTACLFACPLSAAAPPATASPLYNNTTYASAAMTISSSGVMNIAYSYSGIPNTTTKAVITTYIEKKTFGVFWSRVDNGETDKQWVDTYYAVNKSYTRSYQLSSSGTYRVTVTYKIYGTGGSADSIPFEITKSY